ncbi:MAG: DinB family protein [Candidatus Kapabacteria bacterium]|nr:DinB family protein [Candidatus Kapabacteria bacterium]
MTQQEIAHKLRETITAILPVLKNILDENASIRPQPIKWSPKEIIGHLVDSACNNHQKFIRTMERPHSDFVGYKQDFWVQKQHYSQYTWNELISFWYNYNLHLAHVIEHTEPSALSNTISIEGTGPFRLDFIMLDYIEHLKHHLRQILPNSSIQ